MRPPRDGRSARPPAGSDASIDIVLANSNGPQHTRPARRRSTHPPGPGELARARELRRRGLHLKLIETWRP